MFIAVVVLCVSLVRSLLLQLGVGALSWGCSLLSASAVPVIVS